MSGFGRPIGKDDVAWLRRRALRLVADPDVADDLAQEALIAAMRRPPGSGQTPRQWLTVVMLNLRRMDVRARTRRARYERLAAEEDGVHPPDALLESAQAAARVRRALARVDEPFRRTLELRYLQGVGVLELAERERVSTNTIYWRLHEGHRRLRQAVADEGNPSRVRALLLGLRWPLVFVTLSAALTLCLLPGPARVPGGSAVTTRSAASPSVLIRRHLAFVPAAAPSGVTCPSPFEHVSVERELARGRLMIEPRALCALRAAAADPRSPRRPMLQALAHAVDHPEAFAKEPAYQRAFRAQGAAFLYLATGDRGHARTALAAVKAMVSAGDVGATPPAPFALNRATTGLALALAYEWSSPGLDAGDRRVVRGAVERALAAWETFRDPRLEEDVSSHRLAACRATELVQRLALEKPGGGRLAELEDVLLAHVDRTYTATGTNQAGMYHLELAGVFLWPAAHAGATRGRAALLGALSSRSFWRLAMFSGGLPGQNGGRTANLPWGVSGSSTHDRGWSSLIASGVPPSARPAYRWYLERRHRGSRGDSGGDAGLVWAALFYPDDVPAGEPEAAVGRALADDVHGLYLFRSGFRDAGDIQVGVVGDFRSHFGFNAPDAFSLGIRAFDTAFAGGPANSESHAAFSALLVDGRAYTRLWETGAPGSFTPTSSGGYVILDGGLKYRRLGLTCAKRHVLVDFGGAAAPALLSTLDRLRAAGPHVYTWQLNPGGPETAPGLMVRTGKEGGRPTFVVANAQGFLKGWVMHPADAVVEAGAPVKVTTRAASEDIWIVMAIGSSEPAQVSVKGEGMKARLTLDKATVWYDAAADRVMSEGKWPTALRRPTTGEHRRRRRPHARPRVRRPLY